VGSDTEPGPVALDSGSGSTSLVVVEGAGDVGAAVPEFVALVCDPPLLLTVTPDPISVVDDVVPDVVVVPDAVVKPAPAPADADPLGDVEPPSAVVVDEVPVVDAVESDDAAEVADDSEDGVPVSAVANPNPYPVETAATNHAATARPPYPPN